MSSIPSLSFSRDEYRSRVDAVRAKLRERGADVVLIDEKEHLAYLTGFSPSATMYQACILPLEGEPVMVLRRLDETTMTESTWLEHYVTFPDNANPMQIVADTLSELGLASSNVALELDSHYLTLKRFEALKNALPNATFVDFSGVLWEMRLRKSPAEIDLLRRAAHVADQAMGAAIETVGEGVNEREVATRISNIYLQHGADSADVGLIASGKRTDAMHGGLSHHVLQPGDIIHIELLPTVAGYSARMMRPAIVGVPSDTQTWAARELVRIQDEQIASMRPDAVASEVDRICREQVLAAGLRGIYENTTGYTLGYYGSPLPARTSDFTRIFVPGADWRLEPGMVFHMYTSGAGMSFSETVLVTEHGPERLTSFERRLFER